MPIHDWTRVTAGTWHDFHLAWIAEIRNALNEGLLPSDYYAQAEQIVGPLGPDVLTLQESDAPINGTASHSSGRGGGIALATQPPPSRFFAQHDMEGYVRKQRHLVIRHSSGDRIVALLEIVSPGNKSSRNGLRSFVEKAAEALSRGYHLLIIDLFPSTRDPEGIHGAIWNEIGGDSFELPKEDPLTLVSYLAGPIKQAFIEPTAVGKELTPRPLFLDDEYYVNVPLEESYRAAFRGVPRKWREVLEAR